MKLENPDIRDLIAAEYVLGTLTGGARRRFETLMRADFRIQSAVDNWNEKINALGAGLAPVQPPAYIRAKIKSRLGFISEADTRHAQPKSWYSFWRNSALVATFASILLAAVLIVNLVDPKRIGPPASVNAYISLVNNKQNQTAWIIRSDLAKGFINVKTIKTQSLPANKNYELWLIAATSKKPISLGLIAKQGNTQFKLNPKLLAHFKQAKALAVSLEPLGGSPKDVPSGPVLFQGVMHRL